jgi:hypothetical protein
VIPQIEVVTRRELLRTTRRHTWWAHGFTRYPDTATAFAGEKWKLAPGFNIILNGVAKAKVIVTPVVATLVATKMWKPLRRRSLNSTTKALAPHRARDPRCPRRAHEARERRVRLISRNGVDHARRFRDGPDD